MLLDMRLQATGPSHACSDVHQAGPLPKRIDLNVELGSRRLLPTGNAAWIQHQTTC